MKLDQYEMAQMRRHIHRHLDRGATVAEMATDRYTERQVSTQLQRMRRDGQAMYDGAIWKHGADPKRLHGII